MKVIIGIIQNIRNFLQKNSEDNVSAIAAQSAFFIILSFVPFMLFAITVFSVLGIPEDVLQSFLDRELFQNAGTYVNTVFREIYPHATGIAVTTVVLALWSAGKGVFSVTEGIRVIYRLPNKYNWFVKRLFSMGYTFLMFLAVLVALAGTVITEVFDGWLSPLISQLPNAVSLVYAMRHFLIWLVVTLLIALALKMYLWRRVEDKRFCKYKVLLPGAFLASASWVVLSLGIRIYVNFFNGFSVYGSLGTMAMIMVWIYFSMYTFICCVQINYIYRLEFYNFSLRKIFKRKS